MNESDGRLCLFEAANVLEDARVPFFLAYGTALGAYRDKGFTPTEIDIDLGVLSENLVPRAGRLINDFSNTGWEVWGVVRPLNRCWALKLWKRGVGVDLIGFSSYREQRFNPTACGDWCYVYPARMIEHQSSLEMFGRSFCAPSDMPSYLEYEYGEGWRTPAPDFSHRSRIDGYVTGIPINLLDEYGPPLSCGPMFVSMLCMTRHNPASHLTHFYAGMVTGQAEKIRIGACKAAVFRPCGLTRDMIDPLRKIIRYAADLYGLVVVELTSLRGIELWLCQDDAAQDVRRLPTLQDDSPAWHDLRGRLCGVPASEIDSQFHERYR